jgi:hypothetical protein
MQFSLYHRFGPTSKKWEGKTVGQRMDEDFEDFKDWVRKMRKDGRNDLCPIANREFQERLNLERGRVSSMKLQFQNKSGRR